MSRSYKKNPFVTDHSQGTKSMKRIANRVVRRRLKNEEDIPTRLKPKKMTESWYICDYRWRTTKEEAIVWFKEEVQNNPNGYFAIHFPTVEDYLKYWEKWHRRKQVRHKNFYFNDIYLGTLYENGRFDYMVNSNHSEYMNIEDVVHVLERIRLIGLQDDFSFDRYILSYDQSMFKDGFEFK